VVIRVPTGRRPEWQPRWPTSVEWLGTFDR
jgi:hypothetical protein